MTPELELLAVDGFDCRTCGEPKGLACKTPGGRIRRPHEVRVTLARLRLNETRRLRDWNQLCASSH